VINTHHDDPHHRDNDKVVSVGKVPTEGDIEKMIKKEMESK
jgi:hypothetical protein